MCKIVNEIMSASCIAQLIRQIQNTKNVSLKIDIVYQFNAFQQTRVVLEQGRRRRRNAKEQLLKTSDRLCSECEKKNILASSTFISGADNKSKCRWLQETYITCFFSFFFHSSLCTQEKDNVFFCLRREILLLSHTSHIQTLNIKNIVDFREANSSPPPTVNNNWAKWCSHHCRYSCKLEWGKKGAINHKLQKW